MSKLLLSLIAVLSLWAVTAPAQDTTPERKSASDSEKAKADDSKPAAPRSGSVRKLATQTPSKATPASAETPAPKRGFLSRVFGSHSKATPKPSSTPEATPAPKVHRHRPIERNTESEHPGESSTDGTKGGAEKRAEAEKKAEGEKAAEEKKENEEKTPEADKKIESENPADKKADATTPAPTSSKRLRRGRKTAPPAATAEAPSAPVDPETAEHDRFETVKAKALEDPQVQKLKAQADSASTEEDGKKALGAYYKALFSKMRKIDGSMKDRIDIMESVIDKRLNE